MIKYLPLIFTLVGADALAVCPIDIDEWAGRTIIVWVDPADSNNIEVRSSGINWPATDPDGCVCPQCGIIPAFEPNITYLRKLDPPAYPVIDPDYYDVESTVVLNPVAHERRIEYTTVRRADADLTQQLEEKAASRLDLHAPQRKLSVYTPICVAAIWRRLESLPVPAKYMTLCDKYAAMVTNRVLADQANRESLEADVLLGLEPDMDSGWAAPVAGDLP